MPKKKVTVNAGATVIVEINGGQRTYHCSGTNEKTGTTPAEVIKNLQDCIRSAVKGEARRKSTRK